MATRFIGKNLRHKVVRPMKNSVKNKNFTKVSIAEDTIEKDIIKEDDKEEVVVEKTNKKKENKRQKKSKDMIEENKLSQLEAIADGDMPKTKVKIEKTEKGLYERTENSTILLTEDNKMLLND